MDGKVIQQTTNAHIQRLLDVLGLSNTKNKGWEKVIEAGRLW